MFLGNSGEIQLKYTGERSRYESSAEGQVRRVVPVPGEGTRVVRCLPTAPTLAIGGTTTEYATLYSSYYLQCKLHIPPRFS